MSFVRKFFGGGKEEPAAGKPPAKPAAPPHRPPPPPPAKPATPAPEAAPPVAAEPEDVSQMDVRHLVRVLGSSHPETRVAAAERLGLLNDRSAMRPLLNGYMNYGDVAMLEALRGYGKDLGPAVMQEGMDPGLLGVRRARLMDVAAVSGDPDIMRLCRDNLEDPDPNIAVRAAVALARLGDQQGIDSLAYHLQTPDAALRYLSLAGLAEVQDLRAARKAIEDHVERYLAEGGAVPARITLSAPRVTDPTVGMAAYVADRLRADPHSLTVVVGSDSARLAANRRTELQQMLEGFGVHFALPNMAPEEQIETLRQARAAAIAHPETPVAFFGKIPAPHDSPPLPHFLVRDASRQYTAKLVMVDPHEVMLAMDWYHYVVDNAEVPTDCEIILSVSRAADSPMSEEEKLIYQLIPADHKEAFVRAYLAHL